MTIKVLVITFPLLPTGGASSLAAWVLEALQETAYEISVLSWRSSDIARVNQVYGTRLSTNRFRWLEVKNTLRQIVNASPFRLSLIEMMLVNRAARQLLAEQAFDVVFSTANEVDVGLRAIQYIHFPLAYFPRPGKDPADNRWYHFAWLLRIYRSLAMWLGRFSIERTVDNVHVVNSKWTAARFADCYGVPASVIYPPVTSEWPDIPFASKSFSFACLGRISRDKEIPKIIEILSAVRRAGYPVSLKVIGSMDDARLIDELRTLAVTQTWISLHVALPRNELVDVVANCRFGIHGKTSEHFGIAPAELELARCITFVPNDGGSVEVVENDPRLTYGSVEEAANKIIAVLNDEGLQRELLQAIQTRRMRFSAARFMREIRELVASFAQPR